MELFPCEKKKGQRANKGAERGKRRRRIIVVKMAVDHGIASPGDHHDKEHDIILSFGGVKLNFSYELRAAINKCIVGSNEEVEIVILRNGEEIILKAVF